MKRLVLSAIVTLWLATMGSLWAAGAPPGNQIFDPTISLGVVLHLLSLIGTILGALFFAGRFIERQKQELMSTVRQLHLDMTEKIAGLSERLTLVESRTSDLWSWWKKDMRGSEE